MESKKIFSDSDLHQYLYKVCETDRQKLKYKVIQDLQFYFKMTENEAVTIWNESVERGILKHYNHWETDDKFKTYSYDGIGLTDNETIASENDFTDKGMSNTYHNTKTNESLKHGRYGRGRIDSPKRQMQRK